MPHSPCSWGLRLALLLFVAAAVVGLVTCILLAPETKRRRLEEISA